MNGLIIWIMVALGLLGGSVLAGVAARTDTSKVTESRATPAPTAGCSDFSESCEMTSSAVTESRATASASCSDEDCEATATAVAECSTTDSNEQAEREGAVVSVLVACR